jgi:hypothetical protein
MAGRISDDVATPVGEQAIPLEYIEICMVCT